MSLLLTAAGIAYAETGPAAGLPAATVVCLHGIGGDQSSFTPQLERLSARFRVIAWNMPGYRQSTSLPAMTFSALADAVEGLRKALSADTLHLVGHSIGGMIAQEYAHRYPSRVASLALIATTSAFGGRDDSFRDAFLAARLAPLDAGRDMPDLAAEFVPEITGSAASAEVIASAVASMAAVPEATYRAVLACLVTFNRRSEFATLRCPVCLIAGEEDNNVPVKTLQKMADSLPQATCHVIPAAGHLPNLEVPGKTNELLNNFIANALSCGGL